ncbi:cation:proton antiporter [Candidatus Micrarchaeota archaeon]|nr:cation:proton antiporter [Candidatus Micrarchaeota archaeon]
MEPTSILDFGLVLLFSAIAGIISVRLRIPPVAGLLVVGLMMGPNVLNLVSLPTINAFAELGGILLLFMIGVEFSVTKLLSTGLRAVITSIILVLLSFLIMHEVAILIGLDGLTSIFVASMFSMSSTAIMMKILEQKRLISRQEIPTLIAMLIIEDIIAIFILTILSKVKTGLSDPETIVSALLIAIGVLGFSYLVLRKVISKIADIFLKYQNEDSLILFSFTIGIGMSILASLVGLTPAIGAFLAGSIIAGLPNGRDFENAIRPFSLVFSSFFFLSIGMLIDPSAIANGLTLLLLLAFLVTVFFVTFVSYFLISSNGRSSIFAGLAMLPLGEFSLLIAKESVGLVPINLVSIASAGVLASSLICSLALDRLEFFYDIYRQFFPSKLLQRLIDASCYFRNVVRAFEPGGYFHTLFMREVKKISGDVVYLGAVILFLWFARIYLQFSLTLADFTIRADYAALFLLSILSLLPLFRTLVSFKRLFDDKGNRSSFNVIYGKGCFMKTDDLELKSDYNDDAAFFYGKNRLYMKRHIVRAFQDARMLLEENIRSAPPA